MTGISKTFPPAQQVLEFHQFNSQPQDYLAYLGRISPEHGLDTAIRIAHRAGLPLKVAARPPLPHTHDANVRADRAYFNEVVQPLVDEHQVEFVGELDGKDKDRFLGGALALLFPICWWRNRDRWRCRLREIGRRWDGSLARSRAQPSSRSLKCCGLNRTRIRCCRNAHHIIGRGVRLGVAQRGPGQRGWP